MSGQGRYNHFLFPPKSDRQPASILAIEVATRENRKSDRVVRDELLCWGAAHVYKEKGKADRETLFQGESQEQLWSMLGKHTQRGGQTWTVLMPAVKHLSALGLWERLEDGRVHLCGEDWRDQQEPTGIVTSPGAGYCVIEDPPTVIHLRVPPGAGRIALLDCRNWGVGGWEELYPDCAPQPPRIGNAMAWCLGRAKHLLDWIRWMIYYLDESKWGKLQATAGSQATYAWKHRFLSQPVHVHTNAGALDLERAALYAGRNECFHVGRVEEPVYHLDFRSFYPAICAGNEFPALLERYYGEKEEAESVARENPTRTIAECTLRTDSADYPYSFTEGGQMVLYPVGRFRTTLCGPELAHALERRRVDTIWRCATYRLNPCLRDFAEAVLALRYEARNGHKAAAESWAKALGVALPGKLGQHGRRWVDAPEGCPHQPYCTWYEGDPGTRYRSIAWHCQREDVRPEHPESVPAVAAWVTSIGRVMLGAAIEAAGRENCLYCDTDSLFCRREGYANLIERGMIGEGEPGRLRVVEVLEWAHFKGLKWYTTPSGEKQSGRPRGEYSPGPLDSEYWWTQGALEAVRSGKRPTSERVLRDYGRAPGYTHGEVTGSGRVLPLEVWE